MAPTGPQRASLLSCASTVPLERVRHGDDAQPEVDQVRPSEAVGAIAVVIPSNAEVSHHEARDAVRESARAASRELGALTWPPRR